MKPSLSKTTSDAINKFVLNVLGAGGAIWAIRRSFKVERAKKTGKRYGRCSFN